MIKKIFKFFLRNFSFTLFLIFLIGMAIQYWPAKIRHDSVIVLRLDDAELKDHAVPSLLSFQKKTSLHRIRSVLQHATHNAYIKGIVLELYAARISYAHAQEIQRLLKEFKRAGKFIYVYADTFGEGENATSMYYLASVADRIVMQDGGVLNFNGVLLEQWFFKSFLDKHKIKAYVEQREQYKSACEPFTRDNFSAEAKENLTELLKDVAEVVVRDIAHSRKITEAFVTKCINTAPHLPHEAKENKLIDQIGPRQAVYALINPAYALVSLEHYPLPRFQSGSDKVALIFLEGTITRHKTDAASVLQEPLSDYRATQMMKRAVKEGCKAIVLRINSPGGSAVASESIYQTIQHIRKGGVPVVASMGHVAASGGYYIAAGCNQIVAEEMSITGSIGVISAKPIIDDFLKEYGVYSDKMQLHDNADIYSLQQDLTEPQKDKLKGEIDYVYALFLKRVTAHRKIKGDIHDMAGGRVWSGKKAYAFGLVDVLGGIDKAQSIAIDLAQLDGARVKVVVYPKEDFSTMLNRLKGEGTLVVMRQWMQSVWDYGALRLRIQ